MLQWILLAQSVQVIIHSIMKLKLFRKVPLVFLNKDIIKEDINIKPNS